MVAFVAVSGGRNSPTAPTGSAHGDMFLATTRAYYQALTAPTGWQQVGDTYSATTVEYGTYYGQIWKTIRGASTPSLVWGNIYTDIYWSIAAYRNAHPEIVAYAGNGTSYVSPSLDNNFPDGFLTCMTSSYFDISSIPSGMTGGIPTLSRTGYAYQQLSAAGATGTRTWAGDTPIGAWSVLLAPAAQRKPLYVPSQAVQRSSRW